jgi:hypothetical protein
VIGYGPISLACLAGQIHLGMTNKYAWVILDTLIFISGLIIIFGKSPPYWFLFGLSSSMLMVSEIISVFDEIYTW